MFVFRLLYRFLKVSFLVAVGMLLGQYEFEKKPLGAHFEEQLHELYNKNKNRPVVFKLRKRVNHAIEKVMPSYGKLQNANEAKRKPSQTSERNASNK